MLMVPKHLLKEVLKIHRKGYMVINRVWTIKLRYYWKGMDNVLEEYTISCISCKLKKSYQRRPQLPIISTTLLAVLLTVTAYSEWRSLHYGDSGLFNQVCVMNSSAI